eukprot:2552716-Rhodomonas_salina.2
MSHGLKCWLIYSPHLNRVFASHKVTFDDTLFPLKESNQCVYGYYDNSAVTQMSADAYCPGMNDSALVDILHMAEPETSDINCNFDSFTDLEISSCTVPDINTGDVHPALRLSQNTSNEEQMNRSVVGHSGGMNEDSWGVVEDSGGSAAARWGKGVDNTHISLQLYSKKLKHRLAEISTATVSDGQSNGVFTSALRDCFAPSIPELGQLPKN